MISSTSTSTIIIMIIITIESIFGQSPTLEIVSAL